MNSTNTRAEPSTGDEAAGNSDVSLEQLVEERHECGLAISSRKQGQGDDPRQSEDEHRRKFQKNRKHGAPTRLFYVPRAQHALHVRLVRAPVPDAENRVAEQNGQPGELVQLSVGVHHGLEHVELTWRQRRTK